jgi:hypothetical protein
MRPSLLVVSMGLAIYGRKKWSASLIPDTQFSPKVLNLLI